MGKSRYIMDGCCKRRKTCIANALRISARYSNLDIIEDIYGINLLPLATFALEQYKAILVTVLCQKEVQAKHLQKKNSNSKNA